MPWSVWMGFLTVPVLVGVACTLALGTADDPREIATVGVAGGVWVYVAYHLLTHLRDRAPTRWVRWWFAFAVGGPLLTLFVASLRHDPGVRQLVEARWRAGERPDPDERVAVAPARRIPTWAETRELVARLQPPARDFAFKVVTAVPPAWWLVAFVVALWRGR